MTQVGATCLNSALLELLAASADEEVPHLWHDDSSAAAITVPARLGDADHGSWGQLAVAPPHLTFTPGGATAEAAAADGGECGACDLEPLFYWPLDSFAGVDDDADEHGRYELRLLQGEDDGLLFGFENGIHLATFERTLRVAAMSARAAAASSLPTEQRAASSPAPSTPAPAAAQSSAAAQEMQGSKRQKRTEEPRVRKGRELKEALGKVASLFAREKKKEAQEQLGALGEGAAAQKGITRKRAGELRQLLFTFGGFNLTKAILEAFLSSREVKMLLDEDLLKTRQELADAKTATAMLKAAKRFLNEMLDAKAGKTGGRRTDAERNAFWASVVSLMPSDLIENRQGRAMMRILGVQYRTVKKGNTMRKALEDSGKGWVLMETKKHSDRAELHIQIIEEWWHSDEPSCADNNQGKEQVP